MVDLAIRVFAAFVIILCCFAIFGTLYITLDKTSENCMRYVAPKDVRQQLRCINDNYPRDLKEAIGFGEK